MRSKITVPALSILVLTGCMVTPSASGGLDIVPILPAVIEIDVGNYYEHRGYHYFYDNDRWYYASSREGRRSELPRSHWPRETHRRGDGHDR